MNTPTSRQQVLDASDEQLNEWAATVVMGWTKAAGMTETIWEPELDLGDGWIINNGPAIYNYYPASDISQAMGLIDTFDLEWVPIIGRLPTNIWWCSLERPIDSKEGHYYCRVENQSCTRAITQARIMAKLGL